MRVAIAVVTLALLGVAGVPSAQPAAQVVEDWSGMAGSPGKPPPSWRFYAKAASLKFPLDIVTDGGHRALRLKTDRYSVRLARQVEVDLKTRPVLTWEWKALTLPAKGDVRSEINDQVGRVVVMFPPRMTPRMIAYLWDTRAPVGTETHQKQTMLDRWLVVIRSGPADVGAWVRETRNVARDYTRLFGGAPAAPMAIGIESHSEDTAHASDILIGEIAFSPER